MSLKRKINRSRKEKVYHLNPLLAESLAEYKKRHSIVGGMGSTGTLSAFKAIGIIPSDATEDNWTELLRPTWKKICENYLAPWKQ